LFVLKGGRKAHVSDYAILILFSNDASEIECLVHIGFFTLKLSWALFFKNIYNVSRYFYQNVFNTCKKDKNVNKCFSKTAFMLFFAQNMVHFRTV